MEFYGSEPSGIIVRGHFHNFKDAYDWTHSGSSFSFPEPSYIDVPFVAICSYCGNRYMADRIKSGEISNCLGCGAFQFRFERM